MGFNLQDKEMGKYWRKKKIIKKTAIIPPIIFSHAGPKRKEMRSYNLAGYFILFYNGAKLETQKQKYNGAGIKEK